MGSEAETGSAAAAPATTAAPAAAAGGGSMMTVIIVAVVAIVAVAAVVGYVLMTGDSGDSLTGQWTVSGGQMKIKMVMNNDTANTIWNNETIPADPEVINFDDPATMPEGMEFVDLGNGDFKILDYTMGSATFGTITGNYDVDGDIMTLTYVGNGTSIDGTDYMEIEMDVTVTFARA